MIYNTIEVRSTEDVIDTVLAIWNPKGQDTPFKKGTKRPLTLTRQFGCTLKFGSRHTLGVIKELVNLLKSKRQNGSIMISMGPDFMCLYPLEVRHDGTVQVLQTEAEILMSGPGEEESYVWEAVDTFWEIIDNEFSYRAALHAKGPEVSFDKSSRVPPLTTR